MLKHIAFATLVLALPVSGLAQTPSSVAGATKDAAKGAAQGASQAGAAAAKPITKQNTVTKTFTITKIDQATRDVTLRAENGDEDTFTVGPGVTRFNQLKVGDTIKATYTEALVFEVRKPDAPAATTGTTIAGERYKNAVGGAAGAAHTTTVTVKAIDMNAPSITVDTADGRTMTRRIQDKKNLEGVHVGDRIDITYSEAMIVTAEPAKK
jgi:Cu/Ag efflux protein CusF